MAIQYDTRIDRVQEPDLDFSPFHCCGDEDLFPFKCRNCGCAMVFCYECDTLYHDLSDLTKTDTPINSFDPTKPIFLCPYCGEVVSYNFMEEPDYGIGFSDWIAGGHRELLKFDKPESRTWDAEAWNDS